MSSKPKISVQVTVKDKAWRIAVLDLTKQVKIWAKAAIETAQLIHDCQITFVFADDAFVQELNRDYRGKDKPTNVLSFPQSDDFKPQLDGEPVMLGDIILARQTVEQEAKEQGKTVEQHTAHLVIHGCLHVLGHDHETAAEAKSMELLEKSLLSRYGYPDPYYIANNA